MQLDVSSFAGAIAEIIQGQVSLGLNEQTRRGLEGLTQELARLAPEVKELRQDVERLEAAVKAQQSVIEPFFQSVDAMLRYHPDVRARDEDLQAYGDPFLTEFREALPIYVLGRVELDDIFTPILTRAQAAKREADRATMRAAIDRATPAVTHKGMLRKKYLFDGQEFAGETEANAARNNQIDLELERRWLEARKAADSAAAPEASAAPQAGEEASVGPGGVGSSGGGVRASAPGDEGGEVQQSQQPQPQQDPVHDERREAGPAEPAHQHRDGAERGQEGEPPRDQRP